MINTDQLQTVYARQITKSFDLADKFMKSGVGTPFSLNLTLDDVVSQVTSRTGQSPSRHMNPGLNF